MAIKKLKSRKRRIVEILLYVSLLVSATLVRQGVFGDLPFPVRYIITIRTSLVMLMMLCAVESLKHMVILWAFNKREDAKRAQNIMLGLRHFSLVLYSFQLAALFLSFFQLTIKDALTSLSFVAAALAIIFKEYVANIINGMVLAFSNSVSLGDYIKVGQVRGRIIDISLSNTELLSDEDEVVFIPNNIMLTQEITNYSKLETRKSSIEFKLQYRDFDSVEQVEEHLLKQITEFQPEIKDGSIALRVTNVDSKVASFKFQFTLEQSDPILERKIKRKLIRSIVNRIKRDEN